MNVSLPVPDLEVDLGDLIIETGSDVFIEVLLNYVSYAKQKEGSYTLGTCRWQLDDLLTLEMDFKRALKKRRKLVQERYDKLEAERYGTEAG